MMRIRFKKAFSSSDASGEEEEDFFAEYNNKMKNA